MAVARHGATKDLNRIDAQVPVTDAIPTIMVIAISSSVKCPLTSLAMPSRYSQMKTIITNQKENKGSATQPAARERLKLSMTATHEGNVWTRCLSTRWLPNPTPNTSAAIIASEDPPTMRRVRFGAFVSSTLAFST